MDAQWEPIETLPKDETPVLVYAPEAAQQVAIFAANALPDIAPTHWMPLPPPPSDLSISL